MTTIATPELQPYDDESPDPVPPLREVTRRQPDPRFLDPTQGQTLGSDPYDDPTQGRTIGSDPFDDPTRAR